MGSRLALTSRGASGARVWTIIRRASIGEGREAPFGEAPASEPEALFDEIGEPANKERMHADGLRPIKTDARFLGRALRLAIEIVEDFDMIGEEAKGDEEDIRAGFEGLQMVRDVGFKPRDMRRSGAALVDEIPLRFSCAFGDKPRGFLKLLGIARALCHRYGD